MSAAAAVARPKPPASEGTKYRLPPFEAVSPPKFWRENTAKLTESQKDAVNLVNELQGEAWQRANREIPRHEVFVRVSPAQLAKWSGKDPRTMEIAVSALVKRGGLKQQSLGAGKGVCYALDYSRIAGMEPRGPRVVSRNGSGSAKPKVADQFLPVHLDCPVGQDCPVEAVVLRKDGVLINISPPAHAANTGLTLATPEASFGGGQRAKEPVEGNESDSITRKQMVEWLQSALPYERMHRFLPAGVEEQLWKAIKGGVPSEIWQNAIRRKASKIREWPFVVLLVVEAVQEWKHRGRPKLERGLAPSRTTAQPVTEPDPGLCPDCGGSKPAESRMCAACRDRHIQNDMEQEIRRRQAGEGLNQCPGTKRDGFCGRMVRGGGLCAKCATDLRARVEAQYA